MEKTWDFWLFWSSKRSLSGLTPIEDDFVLQNSSSDQGHLQGQAFISLTYTTYLSKIREKKEKLFFL